jgi:hypothetical protein
MYGAGNPKQKIEIEVEYRCKSQKKESASTDSYIHTHTSIPQRRHASALANQRGRRPNNILMLAVLGS